MSPLKSCQITRALTTAVSDLKILGPRLTGITNFFCLIYFISLDEKPPSGPTKIAPDEFDDNSIFAEF
jgi:hypothetical protein